MGDKVEPDTVNKMGDIVNAWEKRIVTFIVVALMGYIANVAGGIKSQMMVMQSTQINNVKVLDSHERTLVKHEKDLRVQDTRLVRVESKL